MFVRLILATFALAFVVTGCGTACGCVPTPSPITPPSGAISKDEAIAAALALAPPSTSLVSANIGLDPFAGLATRPLVWKVGLHGDFPVPACSPDAQIPEATPPNLPECLQAGYVTAVLDLFSGELIGWSNY